MTPPMHVSYLDPATEESLTLPKREFNSAARDQGPCVHTLRVTLKARGGKGLRYAEMIGTAFAAVEEACCFHLGTTYDSDTNHQFMDHVLVGVNQKVQMARDECIPFFKDLRFRQVQMTGFPYRVPVCARASRAGAVEPFYGGRDSAHTLKSGTRSMCTPSTVLHLGDLHVFHGHALQRGLGPRAFSCRRKQSDEESASRVAAVRFQDPIHWTAHGHLVYAVMLRMAVRVTWSEALWGDSMRRLLQNLVPYHFFESCRMMNATRADRAADSFLHPITYLAIHRHSVHNILKSVSWPETWPPFVGARMTEYFAEGQFEAKRRLGPPHGQSCANWITSTSVNHMAQLQEFKRKGPSKVDALKSETLKPETIHRANELAIVTAIKLLTLCCPTSIPEHKRGKSMKVLLQQYKYWWESKTNVPMGIEEAEESSDESVLDDKDQGFPGLGSRGPCGDTRPSLGPSLGPLLGKARGPQVVFFWSIFQ